MFRLTKPQVSLFCHVSSFLFLQHNLRKKILTPRQEEGRKTSEKQIQSEQLLPTWQPTTKNNKDILNQTRKSDHTKNRISHTTNRKSTQLPEGWETEESQTRRKIEKWIHCEGNGEVFVAITHEVNKGDCRVFVASFLSQLV